MIEATLFLSEKDRSAGIFETGLERIFDDLLQIGREKTVNFGV